MTRIPDRLARRTDQIAARARRQIARYLADRGGVKTEPEQTLGRAYDAEWKGYPCTFALSTGRTGSQTMARLLGCSPHVLAEHEPAPRLVMASKEAFMDRGNPEWLERWTRFVLATRDDFVLAARRSGRVYVETNNRMSYLAEPLSLAFPDSRFIFSFRHPHKVIRSGMRRGAYQGKNMAWNFARIEPRADDPFHDRWERMDSLEREAWRWSRINADVLAFLRGLPDDRHLKMSSEEFFRGGRDVQSRLFEFVGVPIPPAEELRHVLERRMNAQDHFQGMDFEWTEETRKRVQPYIEDTAQKLGYTDL